MKNAPGTYALILRADTAQTIEVGALGTLSVAPGAYVYVGSAFGPGGVRARVQRHVRGDGAQHWHIDYLRAVTTPAAVWYTHDADRRECTWASALRQHSGAAIPLDGFGASDCDCPAHLFAFDSPPSFSDVRSRVRRKSADHASLQRVAPSAVLEE